MPKLDSPRPLAYPRDMNVHLSRDLTKFVQSLVSSGRYGSPADVVRAGLRLLESEDEWKAGVRSAIEAGLADVEAGRLRDGEQAIRKLRASLKVSR
jgi:antitoxin ParD1/3/4